jgi:hypothetical protein
MPEMAEARRLLDEAVARTVAQRTAWVRQFVRADRDAPRADDLRLEGAVDLRRRVAVVAETGEDPAPPRRFETDRSAPAGRLLEPVGRRRPVVYAGGSRYVATAAGWEHEAGEISAPRRPSDPVWLLDALGHATACVAEDGAVTCRLDAGGAHDVDWSGLLPAGRRWGMLRGPGGRRRRDALAHVPVRSRDRRRRGDRADVVRGARWRRRASLDDDRVRRLPRAGRDPGPHGPGAGGGVARGRSPAPATR